MIRQPERLIHKFPSVESYNRIQKDRARQKTLLKRRLLVFGMISFIVFSNLGFKLYQDKVRLATLTEKKAELDLILREMEKEQVELEEEIKKLNDDDYIEKYARKEFFLSKEGEIIFIIAED